MEPANHIGFIVAAYAATTVVVGALAAWVTLDYRMQLRRLADLELKGLTRRSTSNRSEPAMRRAKEKA